MHIFSFFLFTTACWLAGHFNEVSSATRVPAPALPGEPGRAYHFHSWVTVPLSILERSTRHATRSGPKILVKSLIPICVQACCSSTGAEKVHGTLVLVLDRLCLMHEGMWEMRLKPNRSHLENECDFTSLKHSQLHTTSQTQSPHRIQVLLSPCPIKGSIFWKCYLNTVELSPKIQWELVLF